VADPVGQGLPLDLDTLARQDAREAVERMRQLTPALR
jgi:hypothetical protein